MYTTHIALAMASLFVGLLASPVQEAASPAVTCHPTTTFSAVFDSLPTGAGVPAGLGGVDWSGFNVAAAGNDDYDTGLNAHSAPNFASISYPIGASISQATQPSDGGTYPFEIKSFFFGCTFLAEIDFVPPSACSIEVIGWVPFQEGSVQTYGPYTFADSGSIIPYGINMTKVELGASAPEFYFVITAGPGVGYAFVDNVVIVNVNTQGACA